MRRRELVIGVYVCVAVLVAAAIAQQSQTDQQNGPSATSPTPSVTNDSEPKSEGAPSVNGSFFKEIPVELKINELIGQWKKAPNESDRDNIQKQLREAVKGQFQVLLLAHQKEIEQLEAKVKQLREQLELRRKKQNEIIDFRVQQLLREGQGLGWGGESTMRRMRTRVRTQTSDGVTNIDRDTDYDY